MQGVDLALHLLGQRPAPRTKRAGCAPPGRCCWTPWTRCAAWPHPAARRGRAAQPRGSGAAGVPGLRRPRPGREVRVHRRRRGTRSRCPPHVKEESYLMDPGSGPQLVAARRRAPPGSTWHVEVGVGPGRRATVADDGAGFDPSAVDAGRTVGLASNAGTRGGAGRGSVAAAGRAGRGPAGADRAAKGVGMTCALPTLRVVLVDDHRLFRESLGALLGPCTRASRWSPRAPTERTPSGWPGSTAPTSSCSTSRCPGSRCSPRWWRSAAPRPSTRIVVLTMHENTTLARQLLLRGASAYLIKTYWGTTSWSSAIRASTEGASGHGDPVGLPWRAGRAGRLSGRLGAVRPASSRRSTPVSLGRGSTQAPRQRAADQRGHGEAAPVTNINPQAGSTSPAGRLRLAGPPAPGC